VAWKDARGVEFTDPRFESMGWSELRTRLVVGRAEHHRLEVLLEQSRERKLLRAHGRQRTEAMHVLQAIGAGNCVMCGRDDTACAA
jgi:hypothetical protein